MNTGGEMKIKDRLVKIKEDYGIEEYTALMGVVHKKKRFKRACRSPEGKIILAYLEKLSKSVTNPYVRGDPHHTAYNCGLLRFYQLTHKAATTSEKELDEIIKVSEDL